MTERKQISLQNDNTQAALEFALTRLEDILGEAYIGSDFDTIRAALTAQLTKTDDNVSCPSVANTGDINAELLEALRSLLSVFDNEGLNADYHAYVYQAEQAIARAEQKDGE